MNVSVVVTAYDEAASIGALLDAIAAQRCDGHILEEILVYDDASTDRTAAIVSDRAQTQPRIRLLRGTVRQGRAGARSAAIDAARGEALVAFDADCLPSPGAVSALCDALDRGAAMTFGACEPVKRRTNLVSRGAAFAADLTEALQRGARSAEFTVGRIFALKRASIAGLRLPADVINDDHWISLRVRELGGAVAYVPQARCRFIVPDTYDDYRRQSARIRAGERQLERSGMLRPLRVADFMPAIAACAIRDPIGFSSWALMYATSQWSVAADAPDVEAPIRSTKGGFSEPAGGGP